MCRAGVEPALPRRVGYSHLGTPMPSRREFPVAQAGFEPAASFVLSEGGLPVAYRAVLSVCAQNRSRTCTRSGLSRAAQPLAYLGLMIAFELIPDGLEPSLPGCRPGVVAAGPRDRGVNKSGPIGSRTRPVEFRKGRFAGPVSSCWTMGPFVVSPGAPGWDSNPHTGFTRYLFSRQAPHPVG